MRSYLALSGLIGMCAATFLGGCASEAADDTGGDDSPVATTGGTASTGGSASTGGETATGGATTDTGGAATGGSTFTPDVTLPFAVDDHYAPSGFMGREDPGGAIETDGIVIDPEGCPSRVEGAVGSCHEITYTPQALDETAGSTWAGVFWESSEQNWGTQEGVALEPGATKVVFTAWAEESLDIQFLAGGIGDLSTEFQDTFKVTEDVTLTTTPTEYELDLSTSTYQYVIGGFGWVLDTDSEDPIVFYVDDIRWEK